MFSLSFVSSYLAGSSIYKKEFQVFYEVFEGNAELPSMLRVSERWFTPPLWILPGQAASSATWWKAMERGDFIGCNQLLWHHTGSYSKSDAEKAAKWARGFETQRLLNAAGLKWSRGRQFVRWRKHLASFSRRMHLVGCTVVHFSLWPGNTSQ